MFTLLLVLACSLCLCSSCPSGLEFQAATSNPEDQVTDFNSCMTNVTAAINFYTNAYTSFVKDRQKHSEKVINSIASEVGKRRASSKCLKAFPRRDAEFYNGRIFRICGGIVVDIRIYQPSFNAPGEIVCGWMNVFAPEFFRILRHNTEVQQRCDSYAIFSRFFIDNFEKCEKRNFES